MATFALYCFKVKKCYSRFHFHVLDYCQWLRIPGELSILRMACKQIELCDITSTSGNFRPYQIQTANIHFKISLLLATPYASKPEPLRNIYHNTLLYFYCSGLVMISVKYASQIVSRICQWLFFYNPVFLLSQFTD